MHATAGFTVRATDFVVPLLEAVIVTAVDATTDWVATENVALVAPAATVTLAGTVAAALLLASVTTVPPVGAAAVKVTVPVEEAGPTTLGGLTDTADRLAAGGAACGVKRRVAENGPKDRKSVV